MTNIPLANCWSNNTLLNKKIDIPKKIEIIKEADDDLYVPNTNKKIKRLKRAPSPPPDKSLIRLLNNLQEIKEQNRKREFQKWLDSTTIDNIRVRTILSKMVKEIMFVTKDKGFTITDENELKNVIASFIYNNC